MQGMEGCSGEWNMGGEYDLNNNTMILNSSKYHCNLCTASYKHYCNLLTHEVKVHGRQKKRGGRKRKSEGMAVYDADIPVVAEHNSSVPGDEAGLNMIAENVENNDNNENNFTDGVNDGNTVDEA